MGHARRPGALFAAVAASALLSGIAAGYGVWNYRDGTYYEEFQDTVGLDLIQAVSVNTVTTSIGVTPGWIWAQPGPSATYLTDTRFSGAGTATLFVQVAAATPYGESIKLFQRFFPATSMDWDNDCATHNPAAANCLIYPVSAQGEEVLHGARSDQVLLVPDIASFNRCQTEKTCKGSGDYVMVAMYVDQSINRDFLLSGRAYNATWWLRSPGQHPSPPSTPGDYNDRLAGFVISYTYTTSGSMRTDYFGGATAGCSEPDTSILCLERSRGCPLHLRLEDPAEDGSATMYLNTPGVLAKAPYTPFSFSFAAGSLRGASVPWGPLDCDADLLGGMNVGLCHDPPGGTWGFFLNTTGTSGNSNKAGASCGTPAIPCLNSRAAASLYIDGLAITAGDGVYLSPAFDSLSDKTQWTMVSWDVNLNADAKGVRTPVQFDWRVAGSTASFGFSSTTFDTSPSGFQPGTQTGTLTFSGPAVTGRYFQYRTMLTSWDENPANPPPAKDSYKSCARSSLEYDGSLLPGLRQFTVAYLPDAGQCVSKVITPGKLWRWGILTYQKDDPTPGQVVCDVLDSAGGVVLANVMSGASLVAIDPGRYPSLRVRFVMYRNGAPVDPRVYWFKLTFTSLQGCLALNRNTVRLSFGENVAVRFCTTKPGMVDVTVHDAAGQLVKKLFHGELVAGDICQKEWNGTSDPMNRPPSSCGLGDTNPQGVPAAPGGKPAARGPAAPAWG